MGFFERIDSGVYDLGLVWALASLVVVISTYLWQRYVLERIQSQKDAGRRFYRAQDRAQVAWERYGNAHWATQHAVFEALKRWELWTNRSAAADLDPAAPGNRGVEWDAISLIQALPEGAWPERA
jgi:hypothetical protein